jgi:hypothetical protein
MNDYSFEEVFEKCTGAGHFHLLLGNGFSQAWNRDIFSYNSIHANAKEQLARGNLSKCFEVLQTKDFEKVINALRYSELLAEVYGSDKSIAVAMKTDQTKLKEILIETLSKHHPDSPSSISESQYTAVRKFLGRFKNRYTLNYDLLLYWSLLHEVEGEPKFKIDDGFRSPDETDGSDYVTWDISNTNDQSVYYLHGALHLSESKTELKKCCWSRTGTKLIDQIRESLKADRYPLFVSEGSAEEKMSRIMKSAYLQRGLKSLSAIGGTLVVFGFALSENDSHILKYISKSKVQNICVSLYGDKNSDANKEIIKRSKGILGLNRKKAINCYFFDADTANVWGEKP